MSRQTFKEDGNREERIISKIAGRRASRAFIRQQKRGAAYRAILSCYDAIGNPPPLPVVFK